MLAPLLRLLLTFYYLSPNKHEINNTIYVDQKLLFFCVTHEPLLFACPGLKIKKNP
jgi:hypothetical protein